MSDGKQGRIVSLRAGTYEVHTDACLLQCRARGKFRNQGIAPLVGDLVRVENLGGGEGFILELLPRKNALRRPPLANLDQLFVVCSLAQPVPNLLFTDSLLARAALCGVASALVFTKCDLQGGNAEHLLETYRAFPCFALPNPRELQKLGALLAGKYSGFCGNTGVGKSTLLNLLRPELQLPTGEISQKLGRGRHVTRHVELFPVCGGFVADTPGFGSLEGELEHLSKENLAEQFREFAPYAGQCRFPDCAHYKDKGCRVLEAVEAGEIPQSRWKSYAALYEELRKKTAW
jgi:ribosome biogenesis GTPase